jgi:hypothetical protein
MSADTIARLKITLDDVEPTVLRRVDVPFDIRLDRLHLTIQAAMGWTNSHLYELRADDVGWSTPYPDADWSGDFLDARKARLNDILEDIGTKKLIYLYDFGDGWEHAIKVEHLADPAPGVVFCGSQHRRILFALMGENADVVIGTLKTSAPAADVVGAFVLGFLQPFG